MRGAWSTPVTVTLLAVQENQPGFCLFCAFSTCWSPEYLDFVVLVSKGLTERSAPAAATSHSGAGSAEPQIQPRTERRRNRAPPDPRIRRILTLGSRVSRPTFWGRRWGEKPRLGSGQFQCGGRGKPGRKLGRTLRGGIRGRRDLRLQERRER